MRHALLVTLAAAGLLMTACSPAEQADTKADIENAGDKVAAETKEAAADVKDLANSPEVKEAGAEIKDAAKDAGALAKDAARETKEAIHDATAPTPAERAADAAN